MTEYTIGYLAVAGVIGVAVACLLYMIGGRKYKIIRRLGSALVLGATVCGLSIAMGVFSLYQLLVIPCLFTGFSLGYGGSDVSTKILRRSIYCLGVCTAGIVMAWTLGGVAWTVLILHVGVGAWSIYLGTRNPIHAAAEEAFVCALLNTGLVMYPFII